MAVTRDTIGLLFQTKADNANAKTEFKLLRQSVKKDIKSMTEDVDEFNDAFEKTNASEELKQAFRDLKKEIKKNELALEEFGNEQKSVEKVNRSVKELRRNFERLKKSDSGKIKSNQDKLNNSLKQSSGRLATIGATASRVAGPLTIAVGILVGAGVALKKVADFSIYAANQYTAYNKEIDNANKLLGFQTETLSGLLNAGIESDVKFAQITDSIRQFTRNLGNAANGSDEFIAKMKRLGIDPQTDINNLEGALQKVFTTINNLPDGASKANAAMDAFGESGTALLPIIAKNNGSIAEMISKARKLGLVMSTEDVKAANDFSSAFTEVRQKILGATFTMAREFLPSFTRALKAVSIFIDQNKDSFVRWGREIGKIVDKAITAWETMADWWRSPTGRFLLSALLKATTGATVPYIPAGGKYPKTRSAYDRPPKPIDYSRPGSNKKQKPSDYFSGDIEKQKRKAEELRRERERVAKAELQSRINILKKQLSALQTSFKETMQRLRDEFKETKDATRFADLANDALRIYGAQADSIFKLLDKLENRKLKKDKGTPTQFKELKFDQDERFSNMRKDAQAEAKKSQDLVTKITKKGSEDRQKIRQDEIKNEIQRLEKDSQTVLKKLEKNLELGLITEEQYLEATFQARLNLLTAKEELLNKEARLFIDNAKETERINNELYANEQEMEQLGYEREIARSKLKKKSLEDQKRIQKELLEVQRLVSDAEKEIVDFRAEQTKKRLDNELEITDNKIEVLKKIRDFEESELMRKDLQRRLDLDAEKQAMIGRIEDKEKEKEKIAEIEELYRQKALLATEEFQAKLKEIRDRYNEAEAENSKSPFKRMIDGFRNFLESNTAKNLSETFTKLADIGANAFSQLASAVGNLVSQWVLYGETGPAVMKKILASVLASIASEAAIQAVYATAYGFLMLATMQYDRAADAFISAATFGAIALGTGLAGRAIAGDSFNQETSGAFGSNDSNNSSNNEAGAIFSSRDDQILDLSRSLSQRTQSKDTIEIRNKTTFADFLTIEHRKNGKTVKIIKEMAT